MPLVKQVLSIVACLPKLEFLNLTKNPLEQFDVVNSPTFPLIKKLALNFTNLSWNSIESILQIMPNLSELYLSGNSYTDVTMDMEPYPSLHLLQLTSNKLVGWNHVVKLDQLFPALTNLIIADNRISSCGTLAQNEAIFKNLALLNMNNTAISEWDELENLCVFSTLKDIRLTGIPLLTNLDEERRRQLLSIYFAKVTFINGSNFSAQSRETIERIYLRHFMDLTTKPKRYSILESKHGKLPELAQVTLDPPTTLGVIVILADKQKHMNIVVKQTVGQLKKSLRSFVGASKFRLFHEESHGVYGQSEIPSRRDNRFIYAMNWCEGDKLYCHVD